MGFVDIDGRRVSLGDPSRWVVCAALGLSSGCSLLFVGEDPAGSDAGAGMVDAAAIEDASGDTDAAPRGCTPIGYRAPQDLELSPGGPMLSPAVIAEDGGLMLYYVAIIDSSRELLKTRLTVDVDAETLSVGTSIPIVDTEGVNPHAVSPGRQPGLIYVLSGDRYRESDVSLGKLDSPQNVAIANSVMTAGRPHRAGDVLFYAELLPDGQDLAVARLPDGRNWEASTPLFSVNSPCDEHSPFLAGDGKTLLFSSKRVPETINCDNTTRLYSSVLGAGGTFSEPIHIDSLGGLGVIAPWIVDVDGLTAVIYATGANDLMRYAIVECE